MHRALLELDGFGNIVLGLLFAFVPGPLARVLGLPGFESAFYPSLFGILLVGIGIALLVERYGHSQRFVGLGLGGALVVNLCFGVALTAWLVAGNLALPVRGYFVLWALVAILLGFGIVETWVHLRQRQHPEAA
jgi:hypothetical protein